MSSACGYLIGRVLLNDPDAAGQEAVLLTESVAISAARLGLYGLKVVAHQAVQPRLQVSARRGVGATTG